MAELNSTRRIEYGSISKHSEEIPIMLEDQQNTDRGEGEMTTERNSNHSVQNQDPKSTLKSIADDLNILHRFNNVCGMIFRALSIIGYLCVIVAFVLLFFEEYVKCSDPLAAIGAGISIVANFGLLVNGQKLRYDNRRCIEEHVLKKFTGPVSYSVLKDITKISLQPEDSAISRLPKWCLCVCCKCGCCCAEPCLPDDPQEPMCTINPCKCLCCKCSCGKCEKCEKCEKCTICKYVCYCFPFLLTFELFESTYYIVSSGWVLCSNVQAIIDRTGHKHGQMIFCEMSLQNQVFECIDVALAIFAFIFMLIFLCTTCCKCKNRTEERPVTASGDHDFLKG